MTRDYRVYLDDILEAIGKIERYFSALTSQNALENDMAIDAIVRNFEVIGEASKRIPESIKRKYPDIPWKLMSGMRDKLIHEYFGINTQTLFKTIEEDLPSLKPGIQKLARELEPGQDLDSPLSK